MPSAEIIAIGSELLLGETLDTNTQFLLQNFRALGVDVFRTMIIGDNPNRISQAIRDAVSRADIVVTTGGLGPTIDDPTRGAVAKAFDCEPVYKPELWNEIRAYFAKMGRTPTQNNKRQAYIPECAEAISNPVGTAPAFYVYRGGKFLVSLPGVPKEMKYLFTNSVIPLLDRFFKVSDVIVMRNLHSFGIGESQVDEMIGELEDSVNPSLGLCAKNGQIDLRITAKAPDKETAEKMADDFERIIRGKLGKYVFGKDDDTLCDVVNKIVADSDVKLRILEINSSGKLCGYFPEKYLREKSIITSGTPVEDAAKFLNDPAGEDCLSVVLALDERNETFIHANADVKFAGETAHYGRSYNALTVNEDDWLLWTLNAIRLMLTK